MSTQELGQLLVALGSIGLVICVVGIAGILYSRR